MTKRKQSACIREIGYKIALPHNKNIVISITVGTETKNIQGDAAEE